jgi:hypothetical protein
MQAQGRSVPVAQRCSVRTLLMTRPQMRPVQQSCPCDGSQATASVEQVCGPRQAQFVSPAPQAARVVGFWQDTPSPAFGQHGLSVAHASPFIGQVSWGISQLQIWPSTQGAVEVEPWYTQLRPVQQVVSFVTHACPASLQVAAD